MALDMTPRVNLRIKSAGLKDHYRGDGRKTVRTRCVGEDDSKEQEFPGFWQLAYMNVQW